MTDRGDQSSASKTTVPGLNGASGDASSHASANRPRQRGIRAALVSLAPSQPSARFWRSIEDALDDQDQLDIVTRPAVRSITEPPPISQPTLDDDPRHGLAAYRPSGAPRPEPVKALSLEDEDEARRRRHVVVGIVVAVLAILGATSVLGGSDNPMAPNLTTTTAPVQPGESAGTAPPAVPGLDAATPLTAAGVGPLSAGMTLGQVEDLGATFNLDQATYDASGGTCFDVILPGASDLTLRFRSPEPFVEVSDPREGILASINIDAGRGSSRLTDAGIGLGATEEQLRGAYSSLEQRDHPSAPGWHVYLVRASGSGSGIAYVTDGSHVTEISIGEVEVIRLRQTCA